MAIFTLQGTGDKPLFRIDYAKELNQEQLDVVLHGDGACLVLAGAGSGKTRTLTYRVAYLLEQGVDPSSILLLTFTNKAAKEMLHRVGALVGHAAERIWGGTFHSVSSRILRAFAEHLGYTSSFSILDADDANDLVKAVMKDLNIDPKARRFPSANVVQDVISYARNTQQGFEQVLQVRYPSFVPFAADVEQIAVQYQTRKKAANVMDFDDLLSNMAVILEDKTLGESIADRFRFVLVDEYQDTNAMQARMVQGFGRLHKNVLVVGDDAQSIYAFRGADVENILSFPKEWPGAKMLKLLTNYRSTPQILELANESLQHNEHKFEKELVAVCQGGPKPRLVPCASAQQEAQYVAEQVLALRNEGVGLHAMAVLFRSSAHSQALEFELMKRDIPYEYRGGQKFFERAHIKDLVSFLRIWQNPKDEIAWMRVLGLQQGIGATTASNLVAKVRTVTQGATEAVSLKHLLLSDFGNRLTARSRGGWEDFVLTARAMIEREGHPSGAIRALKESNYRDYLEREYPNWRERVEDLEQLAVFAESYDDLEKFLADISLYDDVLAGREKAGHTGRDEERMVLSTIHQAKGLEWDTVFVIHLADTAFPNRRAMGEEGGMEEERRLFYVAVTRARRQLFLSYPQTMGYDTLMFNQPSTFLEEVPPRLFERVEVRDSRAFGGYASSMARRPAAEGDGWSWESESGDGWSEPAISYDEARPAKPQNVWKPSVAKKTMPKPGSFLRNVEDL
jgi:DNA helicase-2/ATP-dependent DNA helicase PcrA